MNNFEILFTTLLGLSYAILMIVIGLNILKRKKSRIWRYGLLMFIYFCLGIFGLISPLIIIMTISIHFIKSMILRFKNKNSPALIQR